MEQTNAPYENLRAWRECHKLVLKVYEISERFPKDERFGLTSQIRRAAVSAAANIAEGAAKRGKREKRRFFDISLGSLSEVSCLLRIAHDLGMLDSDTLTSTDELRNTAGKVLWGLYKANLS